MAAQKASLGHGMTLTTRTKVNHEENNVRSRDDQHRVVLADPPDFRQRRFGNILMPRECQGVNFLTNCNIQTNGTCTLATGYTYCYSELIPIGLYIGQCCRGQWSEVQCVVMENLTVTTTTKYGPADVVTRFR